MNQAPTRKAGIVRGMNGPALSPSPTAVFLLGLAEHAASGSVEVGGSHILLRDGQVVDVQPATEDRDLATSLRASARVPSEALERCVTMAEDEGVALEVLLERERLLDGEALKSVPRGVWLERLVRAFARNREQPHAPVPALVDAPIPTETAGLDLLALVLDALGRWAAEQDAGRLEGRHDHHLEWAASPHLERARRWAGFDAPRPSLGELVKTEPGAALRVSALVQAGLARLVGPERTSASGPSTPRDPTSPSDTPALTAAGDPSLVVDAPLPVMLLPRWTLGTASLEDPLERLERGVNVLERSRASGPERAAAWRRLGDAWLERFSSLEEAARAQREAAAAAPEDPATLERAAELCGALGQTDLAVAYARAAVSAVPPGPARAEAWTRYALACRRLGKLSEALGALRAATVVDPNDPEPPALAAQLWRELGRPEEAARAATEAADRSPDPARALGLAARALDLEPSSPERAETYATQLERTGRTDAAIAIRAEAARRTREPDARRSMLLAAAELAELEDHPRVSAELLVRAFDAEPHVDILYEPLDADLAQAGATLERALMLEEFALAAPAEARADWLVRAADARAELREDPAWETELRARALERYRDPSAATPEDPELGETAERLRALVGDETGRSTLLGLGARRDSGADAVQRSLRRAGLAALSGAWEEVANACRAALGELPNHREAALRLRRAAERLGDEGLLREALSIEAKQSLPAHEQARVLSALALCLEESGSVTEALACAERALAAEPRSAEAALLLARHLAAAERPQAVLEVVRGLFGESPPLLEAWARVARDSGDRRSMFEALEEWARSDPYDPEPWIMRLTTFPSAQTARALERAVEGALAPEHLVPALARPLAAALTRLAELGAVERAATLAVQAADALGEHSEPLRALARSLAGAANVRSLRVAVLERRVASQRGDERVELLHAIAQLHERDPSAEARTHLRVLAARAYEPRSLARLAELYEAAGATERLLAVLRLELEATPAEARTTPLLRLVAAHLQLRGDPARAKELLRETIVGEADDSVRLDAAGALATLGESRLAVDLLRETARALEPPRAAPLWVRATRLALETLEDPRLALSTAVEGLEHAPGSGPLLVAFERLALGLRDLDAAEHTFERLAARALGRHGRRALAYRHARWLERAGAPFEALGTYRDAFGQEPRADAVYRAIVRLAHEQGLPEARAEAATLLAERAAHPAVRARMLREAALVLERDLSDRASAFDLLVRAWEAGHGGVEDELVRLAGALRHEDPAAGDAAFGRLIEELRRRVDDAWMAEAKARVLLQLARIHALGRGDLDAAAAAIDEGLALLREDGSEPEVAAELLLELAGWLADAGRVAAAAERVAQALAHAPDHADAAALAARMGAALAPPSTESATARSPLAASPTDQAHAVDPEPADASRLAPEGSGAEPSEPAIEAGSPEFPAAERWPHASALLAEPHRVAEWRALAHLDLPRPEVQVARSLLGSLRDGTPTPLPEKTLAALRARSTTRAPRDELWRMLWEHSLPLFRQSLDPRTSREQVTRVATSAEARAFAAALDALGREDLPLFHLVRTAPPELSIVRSWPPTLVAGPRFAADERSMCFALARALRLSEPDRILIATLPEARAATAIAAVTAAFGPADGGPVSREAATMAAELWATMPARVQSAVREHLHEGAPAFTDYAGTRASAETEGARAGLAACGDLGVALRVLAGQDTLEVDARLAALLGTEPAATLARDALRAC